MYADATVPYLVQVTGQICGDVLVLYNATVSSSHGMSKCMLTAFILAIIITITANRTNVPVIENATRILPTAASFHISNLSSRVATEVAYYSSMEDALQEVGDYFSP